MRPDLVGPRLARTAARRRARGARSTSPSTRTPMAVITTTTRGQRAAEEPLAEVGERLVVDAGRAGRRWPPPPRRRRRPPRAGRRRSASCTGRATVAGSSSLKSPRLVDGRRGRRGAPRRRRTAPCPPPTIAGRRRRASGRTGAARRWTSGESATPTTTPDRDAGDHVGRDRDDGPRPRRPAPRAAENTTTDAGCTSTTCTGERGAGGAHPPRAASSRSVRYGGMASPTGTVERRLVRLTGAAALTIVGTDRRARRRSAGVRRRPPTALLGGGRVVAAVLLDPIVDRLAAHIRRVPGRARSPSSPSAPSSSAPPTSCSTRSSRRSTASRTAAPDAAAAIEDRDDRVGELARDFELSDRVDDAVRRARRPGHRRRRRAALHRRHRAHLLRVRHPHVFLMTYGPRMARPPWSRTPTSCGGPRLADIVGPAVRRARTAVLLAVAEALWSGSWSAAVARAARPPGARRRSGFTAGRAVAAPLRRAHARLPSRCSCSRWGSARCPRPLVLLVVVVVAAGRRLDASLRPRMAAPLGRHRAGRALGRGPARLLGLRHRRRRLRRRLRPVRAGRARPASRPPNAAGRASPRSPPTRSRRQAAVEATAARRAEAALVDREERLGEELHPVDERSGCRRGRGAWRRRPACPAASPAPTGRVGAGDHGAGHGELPAVEAVAEVARRRCGSSRGGRTRRAGAASSACRPGRARRARRAPRTCARRRRTRGARSWRRSCGRSARRSRACARDSEPSSPASRLWSGTGSSSGSGKGSRSSSTQQALEGAGRGPARRAPRR